MPGSASTPGCVWRRRPLISCCADNYTGEQEYNNKQSNGHYISNGYSLLTVMVDSCSKKRPRPINESSQ